jgi:hypothetical protein
LSFCNLYHAILSVDVMLVAVVEPHALDMQVDRLDVQATVTLGSI